MFAVGDQNWSLLFSVSDGPGSGSIFGQDVSVAEEVHRLTRLHDPQVEGGHRVVVGGVIVGGVTARVGRNLDWRSIYYHDLHNITLNNIFFLCGISKGQIFPMQNAW